eukprot:14822295-Ditylum_brightwellii.AAC.1
MSLDIYNMYPSIQVKLIQKALDHYTNKLPISARRAERYYKYNVAAGKNNVSDEDIGLTIGRYKSAFLANTIASYLFEMTNAHFVKANFRGMYCNDGLIVFKGHQTPKQI